MGTSPPRGTGQPHPEPLSGIFAILVTPFDNDDRLDEQGLKRQVRFCAEAGAHGVVGPAVFAEFHTLSDAERKRFVEVAAEAVREIATPRGAGGVESRRIPFVAACSGVSAAHAVELARHAEQAGADAVMLMPPYVERVPVEAAMDYFRRVAGAISLPVILQNPPPLLGWPLPTQAVAKLVREVPNIQYVKEETPPEHHHISALIAEAAPKLKGVFGGVGGMHMLAELRRGAVGNMPAAEFVDVHVRIYNAFQAGNEATAQELYRRLLPAVVQESLIGPEFSKEILRRRGVLSTVTMRAARSPMDDADRLELDRLWPELEKLFSWKGWK